MRRKYIYLLWVVLAIVLLGWFYQEGTTNICLVTTKAKTTAKADYYNRVIEGNEANNQNQMEFAIGRSF